MTRIAVFGANGRMGKVLCEAALISPDTELAAAYVRDEHDLIGTKVQHFIHQGKTEVTFSAESVIATDVDVAIDFTLPAGMKKHLGLALEQNTPLVIGTTGLTADDMAELKQAATQIPIVFSRNFSVGINLLENLVKQAAKTLSDDVDIEIFELHHKHKIDAPSGTALMIGEAIAEAKGWDHQEVAKFDRSQDEHEKSQKEIGYSVMRGGDIVGEHTAYFATEGERLELTHKASSKMTFAKGAVRAAKWLRNKPNGLYDMQDVLGFRE
ncbi:4-hydroxy-tetrahydrodipicolinate reductase [Pseudoalteromonas sp. S16_S37]|uniref:4-hydroxy-tetrahydrodipicolinate reductase n=1 Tax=Pseudoalteromonas sp. S16_S37 TaxID=2720228 RepID=UPI0016805B9E|nr:4-hydroxy-tetrahydrodipicolinate reductase [Pseudoalteromonas sp. S16_S37]MBD1584609.1 4-hydroxy-tetrahydrodipicolinate reductase [Pseudoalteromonas sp. S16_S37]